MTPRREIRLGHIDLSFHAASAAVVERMLVKDGHDVIVSAAPHEESFAQLGRGDIDMLASAWLPTSHGRYLEPIDDLVSMLGVLYNPYCIWGVPGYVPESEVRCIHDLLKPSVLDRMNRCIQGINPGAGISRFSARMVSEYGLENAGYYFQSGTQDLCFSAFEKAYAQRLWLVIPLWHPQYLHHRYRIRALDEPLGLLGGVDKATLVARKDAVAIINPSTLRRLTDLKLGNAAVTSMDDLISKTGMTPSEAASSHYG